MKYELPQRSKGLVKTDDLIIIADYFAARINPDNVIHSNKPTFYQAFCSEIRNVRENSLIDVNIRAGMYEKAEMNILMYMRSHALPMIIYRENLCDMMSEYFRNILLSKRLFIEKSNKLRKREMNYVLDSFRIEEETESGYIADKVENSLFVVCKNSERIFDYCCAFIHSTDDTSKSRINLSEANKYFFGTENTSEVKKLFESTSSDKKAFTAIFLKEFNKNKESIIKSSILDALNAPSDMCIEDLMDDFKPRAKRFSLQWYSEWLKRYVVWYLLDNSPDSPYSGLDGDLYDWFSWGLSALKKVWEITQEIENGYEEFIQQR